MPLAQISTNSELSPQQQGDLHECAARFLAECLGKNISSCMVILDSGLSMSLGEDRSLCALIEISGIELIEGGAAFEDLAKRLGGGVAAVIGASSERVFVKFSDVQRGMWGNGAKIFY